MEMEVNISEKAILDNLTSSTPTLVSLLNEIMTDSNLLPFSVSARASATTTAAAGTEGSSWTTETINKTLDGHEEDFYVFDLLYVRIIFIILYTIVFLFCFFGNLMVILVVTLHWRMRNITKFCLGNLAFADLCVGIFCVYQNLSSYLANSWMLGEFMCKTHHYINALSHTASILILVVICVERYLAILHPFRCKRLLTIKRLRYLIVGVWVASAIYCSPRLYYMVTFKFPGAKEIMCIPQRTKFDSKTFDMIHFFLLFLLPLLVISILYTRVGITLWRSSKNNLPWTTTTSSTGTESANISRSSSGTIYEDIPINSRVPSIRLSTVRRRDREQSIRKKDKRDLQDVDELELKHINSLNTNSNKPGKSSFKGSLQHSPPTSNNSSSYRVTVENKCYVVGPNPNELQITDIIDSGPEILSHSPASVDMSTNFVDNETESNCMTKRGLSDVYTSNNKQHPHFNIQLPLTPDVMPLENSNNKSSRGTSFRFRRDASLHCSKKLRSIKKGTQGRNSRSGKDALKSRQTVVKMLIVIVFTFALCNFPFHLRKMFTYWWPNYDNGSVFSTLITPLTHLIMYANCAINPIIYAFMSKVFRSSFQDLLCCRFKKPFHVEAQNVQSNSHG